MRLGSTLIWSIVLAASPTLSHAAVVEVLPADDPSTTLPKLITSNPIDPAGGNRDIQWTAANATSQDTLEALPGFAGVQIFEGVTAGTNTFVMPDAAYADLQVRWEGNFGPDAGTAVSNGAFATSQAKSLRFARRTGSTGSTAPTTMVLDFGDYDSEAQTFDGSVNGVSAVAFTVTAPNTTLNPVASHTATFYDAAGAVLATQVYEPASPTASIQSLYFGYQSTGAAISHVTFTVVWERGDATTPSTGPFGIDDISFSPVPEPGTLGLLMFGGMVTLARR